MEETPHVFVSGEYAVEVAEEYGVETERELLTDENRDRFEDAEPPEGGPGDHLAWLSDRFGGDPDDPDDHDTVGAVARHEGSFAAATSTGGRWFALAGRVGDVPQVGSGFYCSPAGGASATGAGEDIARVTLSRRAVQYLEDGTDAGTAARNAIDDFGDLTEGSAGVIVLGEESAGRAFNSDAMQTAVARH
jgi:beta-aspartyl-peptidase (threonine type)